jgi:hypothetical protein
MLAATRFAFHPLYAPGGSLRALFRSHTGHICRTFRTYLQRFEQLLNSYALAEMRAPVFSTTSTLLCALQTGLSRLPTITCGLFGQKVGVFPESLRVALCLQKKQGGSQEAALLTACFEQRLNRSSTAEEVEQNGDNRQNQQNVNEAAGHVECREAQKPQNQENSGNDR